MSVCTMKAINQWLYRSVYFYLQKLVVDFFIDLHAHSTLMNGFMYGNTFDDIERYERQALFPKLLCNNADDFSLANTNFNKDAVKAGTGRRQVVSTISAAIFDIHVADF